MKNEWNAVNGTYDCLGATQQEGRWNFALPVPEGAECRLHIYRGAGEKPVFSAYLQRGRHAGLVSAIAVEGFDPTGCTYLYEMDGRMIPDPYARRLVGREQFGVRGAQVRAAFDAEPFDWKKDESPAYSFEELVLYQLHVRGYTAHASAGVKHGGTYLGLCEKLPYLKRLGVNAVLLLPCVEFDEILSDTDMTYGVPESMRETTAAFGALRRTQEASARRDKVNFWGFGQGHTLFAPKAAYAVQPERVCTEFREMVRQFHHAGIEVLLDFDFLQKQPRGLVLAALRFWVTSYHIDGFRLNPDPALAVMLAEDPYLARTKLLAADWYGEVNKQGERRLARCDEGFLQDVRRYIKGDEGMLQAALAQFCRRQSNMAVINFITDNNGFTLADLYAYDRKHNEENGEQNADGTDHNFSWNCGEEGVTKKKKLMALRMKMCKNAMLFLLLAQGTPLLRGGDEFLNSQRGNNNAYCQDNETGWVEWNKTRAAREMTAFVRELLLLRQRFSRFYRGKPFLHTDYYGNGCPDLSFHGIQAWSVDFSSYCRTAGILLNDPDAHTRRSRRGEPVVEIAAQQSTTALYFVMNMHWEPHVFELPILRSGGWSLLAATDTAKEWETENWNTSRRVTMPARAILLLRHTTAEGRTA